MRKTEKMGREREAEEKAENTSYKPLCVSVLVVCDGLVCLTGAAHFRGYSLECISQLSVKALLSCCELMRTLTTSCQVWMYVCIIEDSDSCHADLTGHDTP